MCKRVSVQVWLRFLQKRYESKEKDIDKYVVADLLVDSEDGEDEDEDPLEDLSFAGKVLDRLEPDFDWDLSS